MRLRSVAHGAEVIALEVSRLRFKRASMVFDL
jgi:hypothetical protein